MLSACPDVSIVRSITLTLRTGITQSEAMGAALAADPGMPAGYHIWSSPSGRTLQTKAIIAEYLGRDFFGFRTDARLLGIHVGMWEGRLYDDIVAEVHERAACKIMVELLSLAHERTCETELADVELKARPLPGLTHLRARFSPDPATLPTVSVELPSLAVYNQLLTEVAA